MQLLNEWQATGYSLLMLLDLQKADKWESPVRHDAIRRLPRSCRLPKDREAVAEEASHLAYIKHLRLDLVCRWASL